MDIRYSANQRDVKTLYNRRAEKGISDPEPVSGR